MDQKKVILISGGSGYLGRNFAAYFEKQNYLVKVPSSSELNLKTKPTDSIFENVDIFIHLAYDFSVTTIQESEKINADGSQRFFQAARQNNIKKIIHISSMSAYASSRAIYGKTKFKIEQEAKDVIHIRPGLVYSKNSAGIFKAIQNLTRILPIIPMTALDQNQYLVHVDDLSSAIVNIIEQLSTIPQEPIVICNPEPIQFGNLIRFISKTYWKKIFFIHIPYPIVFLMLVVLNKMGFFQKLRADSLISLRYPNPNPHFTYQDLTISKCRCLKIEDLSGGADV